MLGLEKREGLVRCYLRRAIGRRAPGYLKAVCSLVGWRFGAAHSQRRVPRVISGEIRRRLLARREGRHGSGGSAAEKLTPPKFIFASGNNQAAAPSQAKLIAWFLDSLSSI